VITKIGDTAVKIPGEKNAGGQLHASAALYLRKRPLIYYTNVSPCRYFCRLPRGKEVQAQAPVGGQYPDYYLQSPANFTEKCYESALK